MGKTSSTATEAIPHPPAYPVVGNVLAINPDDPIASIVNLMNQYGPIITLKFPKETIIAVGSQEYVHELCDQERYIKNVSGALKEVRSIAKDGEHLLIRYSSS
jgi:cytochrome P450/NADPH-cytochrome P450 reductase